jgi:CDP-glucose 4,6-dehydratase
MDKSSFWADRTVFVTGGTGLLGSWLIHDLVEKKANVVALVRDNVPHSNINREKILTNIITVRGDLENYPLIERILHEYEIETVFHLGAQTLVTIANNHPVGTFKANIEGTWNILEASRKTPSVERIVVASSDKAYGDQPILPYNEKTPLQGRHPYDVSKSCADLICQSYANTYHVPVCVTRCGNFFGGGDLNFNRIIPGTIKSVLLNKPPVIRSDGSNKRDYFYILDGVYSYELLAEKMENRKIHGEAYNFSNETPQTVLDVVNKILHLMKSDLKPIIENKATNEIKDQYLDSSKAARELKWKPKFDFDSALNDTIIWYNNFFKDLGYA